MVFLFCIFCNDNTFAQLTQPQRIEFELGFDDDQFFVMPAQEKGMVLFRETTQKDKQGNYEWEFLKYDTSFTQEWTKKYALDQYFQLTGIESDDKSIFLLLQKKSNFHDYQLISLDLVSGDTLMYPIYQFLPLTLTEFTIVGKNALLVGRLNFRSAVIQYNMETRRIKVLPGFYQLNSDVLELKIDPVLDAFHVLTNERGFGNKNFISLRIFDQEGSLLKTTTIKPEKTLNFLEAKATLMQNGDQIVVGTYGVRSSNYSHGIFIAKVNAVGDQQAFYYSYGDLENFFGYLKPKKEDRIRKKIKRRKQVGRPMNYYYKMNVSDIFERQGHFIMLAEAYHPYYFYEHTTPLTYDGAHHRSYGSLNYYNSSVSGYKYTHAILVGFDKEGNLKWDNSLEISDMTSIELQKNVTIGISGDKVAMFYLQDQAIRSKIIQDGQVVQDSTLEGIKLQSEEEEAFPAGKNYFNGNVEWWYGNYFFAYGVQRLKTLKGKEEKGNKHYRTVFYINKLHFK
jgi:hypothetical protein